MKKIIFLSIIINILFADIKINENDLTGEWFLKPEKNKAINFMMGAGNLFQFELMKNNKARKKVYGGYSNYTWRIKNNNIVKLKYITGNSSFNIADFILDSNYNDELKILKKINSYCYKVFIKNFINDTMCNSKDKFGYMGQTLEPKKKIEITFSNEEDEKVKKN